MGLGQPNLTLARLSRIKSTTKKAGGDESLEQNPRGRTHPAETFSISGFPLNRKAFLSLDAAVGLHEEDRRGPLE